MIKKNVAIIFGGRSVEHEVSIMSAKSVIASLDKDKYEIILVAITRDGGWHIGEYAEEYIVSGKINKATPISPFEMKKLKIDIVIPILHGSYGEDGKLQGLLEILELPYLFSGVTASSVAMNKYLCKRLVETIGIVVAEDIIIKLDESYNIKEIINNLNLPIVVKPANLGSSVGMNIAKDEEELLNAIENVRSLKKDVLLEKYIKGRELTVPLIGNGNIKALPVIEIIPKISTWFDYRAKYTDGGSDEVCPANISEELNKEIQVQSMEIYKLIGCRDLARVDFIYCEEDDKLYFLEINTIPGLTKNSLTPKSLAVSGITMGQLFDNLINNKIGDED